MALTYKLVAATIALAVAVTMIFIAMLAGEAQDRNATPPRIFDTEHCATLHSLATQIMRTRQAGAPLERALAVTDDREMLAMVREAWQQPVWRTQDEREAQVDRFATLYYAECMGGAR
jgi:hypothetical protein